MDSDTEREEIDRDIAAAVAKIVAGRPAETAMARGKRRKSIKSAVVNAKHLRSSDRSQTTIAFRGSLALKKKLKIQSAKMRATSGEKFNEWIERILETALEAEAKESSRDA